MNQVVTLRNGWEYNMKIKQVLKEMSESYLASRSDLSESTLYTIKYVINYFIDSIDDYKEEITESDYLAWSRSLGISDNTKCNYQKVIRQFIIYVNGHGYRFMIPDVIKSKDEYVPYYFSEEEYLEIINSVDNYRYTNHRTQCEDYCLPMITRILMSTGARVSEICSLKIDDYDRGNGVLHIKNTKKRKERLIPLHSSLITILNRYIDVIKEIDPGLIYMFPLKDHNRHMTKNHIENTFMIIFRNLGYKRPDRNFQRGVCLHCFRHNFAIDSFKQSLEQGYDIVDVVPFLSIYLGHARLSETEKYLKFSSDLFPDNIKQFEDYMDDVFTEYDNL